MLFEGPDHPALESFDMEGRLEFLEEFGIRQSLDPIEQTGKNVRRWTDPSQEVPDGEPIELLNFASNDFLDLASDDRVTAAAAKAAKTVGAGASASRNITGDTVAHRRLERDLATARNSESAIVFPSTYAANVGVLTSLYPNVVFSDEHNHTSIVEASRMSGAEIQTYDHCDVDDLESQLDAQAETGPDNKWVIVTESVYSMDGDIPPLASICDLADEYDAWVVVDGAHACGLYQGGGGIVQQKGLSDRIDVQIGALSKALASQGGYVTGESEIISYFSTAARPFIFSTALNPPAVAAARKALQVATGSDRPERLMENASYLRTELGALGYEVRGSTNIVPVMIRDRPTTSELASRLLDHGVLVYPVPYPGVPLGTSRVRVNPMATHTRAELESVIDAFEIVGHKLDIV
jgi:8-amino-7-oxononanoate synthase